MKNFMRQQITKKPLKLILALSTLLWNAQANAYCFMVPESITYAPTTYAWAAGYADSARVDEPLVQDLVDGKVILANIYSVSRVDLEFTFEDNSKHLVSLGNGEGIGLTDDIKKYYIIKISPLELGVALNTDTDVWAKGNWPYWYPNIQKDTINGQEGGYLRTSIVRTGAIDKTIAAINFKKIVWHQYITRNKDDGILRTFECEKPSQMILTAPNPGNSRDQGGSEAPFTTKLFAEVPCLRNPELCPKRPVNAEWNLLRTK